MKRLFILYFLCIEFISFANAQISTSSWHDGYWGEWKSHTTRYSYLSPTYEYGLSSSKEGIAIYNKGDHPSAFFFRFAITTYFVNPDKKTKKAHIKYNTWYEYQGKVEYYVTEEYPDIVSILRKYDFPCFNVNSGKEGNPCVKRTANATIKIAPYKDHPRVYNIYFDNVAVAISFDDIWFTYNE